MEFKTNCKQILIIIAENQVTIAIKKTLRR